MITKNNTQTNKNINTFHIFNLFEPCGSLKDPHCMLNKKMKGGILE